MRETTPRFRARTLRRLPRTAVLLALALSAAACGSGQKDPTPTAQVTFTGATSLNATYGAFCTFLGEKGVQIALGPKEEAREKTEPTLFLSFSDYSGSSGYDTLLVSSLQKGHGIESGRGGAHVDVMATQLSQPTRAVLSGSFSGSYTSPAGLTHVAGTFAGCAYQGVTP